MGIWLVLDVLSMGSKKQVSAMDWVLLGSKSNSMLQYLNQFCFEHRKDEVGLKLQLVENQELLC